MEQRVAASKKIKIICNLSNEYGTMYEGFKAIFYGATVGVICSLFCIFNDPWTKKNKINFEKAEYYFIIFSVSDKDLSLTFHTNSINCEIISLLIYYGILLPTTIKWQK